MCRIVSLAFKFELIGCIYYAELLLCMGDCDLLIYLYGIYKP